MGLFRIDKEQMKPSGKDFYVARSDDVSAQVKQVVSPTSGKPVVARALPRQQQKSGIIDVYNNFDWSASPSGNADFFKDIKPPFAKLTEYRMDDNAVINALLYYVSVFSDQTGLVGNAASSALGSSIDVQQNIDNVASVVREKILSVAGSAVAPTLAADTSPWMRPYNGLYALTPTDFTYYFPYFNNLAMSDVTGNYGPINFPGITNIAGQVGEQSTLLNFSRIIAPGQYVEVPKMFLVDSAGNQQVTIEFPLLNTFSFESAVKNYHLLWLLIFQNTPQRVTKSLLDLPRIYDVHIPGSMFLKFAFVSSLSVDFIGNRRRVTIPMPVNSIGLPAQAEVVMPDAYKVTMTLISTITHTNNTMLENWRLAST